ncbi:ROK family protein [Clostridium niameyense]|uniref:ROK family protein n=1 Tax=Clostridium niameyense TaxID=1622073 RepID=UPI00067F178A|nr:ROK family protein [Clostridium niameyense]
MLEEKYVIGVDLGGTKINTALSNVEGNIVSKCTLPTNSYEGDIAVFERILNSIEEVINNSKVDKENIISIGIGSPGPLDYKKGRIITTPNLPFKDFDIVSPIENKFGIKTYLDNDANVASIGEYIFGSGKESNNMIFVTVSTGIGAGAILNGKIYRGNTSNALEIGHTTLKKDGTKCNCGNYGCAEALASGTAIGKKGREAVERGLKTSLSQYKYITAKEVFKEAKKNDKVALGILDESLEYLGICVANLISSFDPERIIIGGGVSKAGKIVFDKIEKVVKERCFKVMYENTKILPAILGDDAGVMGAIALAIMESK